MSTAGKVKNKPQTLTRDKNHVIISWEVVFLSQAPNVHPRKFILQMKNYLKQYQTIYWGAKTTFKIQDLQPCTCYDLRLKVEGGSDWIEFKTASQADGLFFVRHMTRAVKFAKIPLLRKIAHTRSMLLEVENKDNKTPLVQAIEKGDLPLVNFLINLGANVNTVSLGNRRSPLMVAVFLSRLQIASFLVDKGAKVHLCDVNGLNVLHYAVDSNNIKNVKFGLLLKIDINLQDCCGWSPLLRAVILDCHEDVIQCLLAEGADRSLKDKNGFDFEKHRRLQITDSV